MRGGEVGVGDDVVESGLVAVVQTVRSSSDVQDADRRPFLLPRVKARRRKLLDLLSSVGDEGLLLPDD